MKKITITLTEGERQAIILAMDCFLLGDDKDRLGLWLHPQTVKAAERAREKLNS